jgi:signal transduction histidine kinase
MPRLFEPFFTTKKHGSGLGLPISRKIVEAHGGKIEVQRIQPHGTLFTLQLPVQKT